VYNNTAWKKLDKAKLDPHFQPDEKGPVARFNSDIVGLEMALLITGLSGGNATEVAARRSMLTNILRNFS
jgi:hypothetical protein